MNSQGDQIEEVNDKEDKDDDVYFLILMPSEENFDFQGKTFKSENILEPTIIYRHKVEKGNGTYLEELVFKGRKQKKSNEKENEPKKSTQYLITYFIEEHIYNITFSSKNESFIYQPKLEIGNKYLQDIPFEPIKQNIVPLYNKLNIFLEALKQTKEINQKEEKLYKDTIDLYEQKKQFSLLINLFLKIYAKNKELCKNLIEIFFKINDQENNDKLDDLKKNLKSFKDILSNARDILDENNYDPIHFYGLLFCYLHFYDEKSFPKIIEEFSEGNSKVLYEILIHYHSHFINPLQQSQKFFDYFIQYALNENKKIEIFERILNYIEDIETYLFIINKYEEKIFKRYSELRSRPFEMDGSLKLLKYKKDITNKTEDINQNQTNKNQPPDEDDEKKQNDIFNIAKLDKENECHSIVKIIEAIIRFSKKEKILVIYMRSTFWIKLLEQYNAPDWENICNCHMLRELYKKYNNLINILYENDKENDIKNDINRFLDRDQFAIMLNYLIKKFLENNQKSPSNAEKAQKSLKNMEMLGIVRNFNPYFSIEEKDRNKYKNNRETYIFDYVNFSDITPAFIKAFHIFNFETMFEENITEYINKITEKIVDIQTFGNIIKLVDETRMKEENQKDYFRILKEKYNNVIKNNIDLIKEDKELKNGIKIIADFVSKLFLIYNNNEFLEHEIGLLEDNIKSLIYLELITSYNETKYENQKKYLYEQYLKRIKTKEGRENVIKLVKNLKDDDRNYFIYKKLLNACLFTRDEFFSNHENYKIQQLCLLKKELDKDKDKNKNALELNILKESEDGNKDAKSLEIILDAVHKELEYGAITKRDLEIFLNIKKLPKNTTNISVLENNKNDEYTIEKLGLISLTIKQNYVATQKYVAYKQKIQDINNGVEELISIKNSLMIFHRNIFIDDIKQISKIIDEIENSPISSFKTEKIRFVDELKKKHKDLCRKIDKVKDFLLFKKIFDNAQGKDQNERFINAYKDLKSLKISFKENPKNIVNIFNNEVFAKFFKVIKDELGRKDEKKSEEFLEQMKKYFEIKDDEAIKDLKMLIKSKKYEMIVKSIDYFFKNFLGKDLCLSETMKNLSDQPLDILKKSLGELKKKDYYDYESKSPYYRVFTSIYEKKEAIDFLISKIEEAKKSKTFKDLNDKLQKNLDPTNRSITIKDISDTIDCLKHVNRLLDKDIQGIIKYLKELKEEDIEKFDNFSKKFASIIALDNKTGEDSFKDVYDIVQKVEILFHLDSEYIKINGENEKIKNINELIKLGSKINIQGEREKREITDIFELKCDKLKFFKDVVSKIEIIYDKINKLRTKGFNIPIEINIDIKYPNVEYNLYGKQKDFNYIKEYLFKIQNDYETQLGQFYESHKYLRFLYGKLFRKVNQHQKGNCEIVEIIRYILNKTKLTKGKIKDSRERHIFTVGQDYEVDYKSYTTGIFKSISDYLLELFKANNDLDFQKHYENMLIKEGYKNKGISIMECKKEQSMEENILYLFAKKLDKLPIAQNILICSRETTIEEMQSFLYRAILCEYNTLFVLEILDSFSNFQQNKMYGYIDKLTSIKMEKYSKKNKDNKKKIDKSNSSDYLDSYIVFIYKKLSNESAFKNELSNYIITEKNEEEELEPVYIDEGNKMGELDISNISFQSIRSIKNDHIDDIINNITVISSEVCGLGKSFKIKKMIKDDDKKNYYHFPLGGKLTKNIIYQKILDLFEKIGVRTDTEKEENSEDDNNENENDKEYLKFENVAIHLDIVESKEIDLINEFLFSFLITKFYTNNENIIYIPNNIKIYIEVPNSTENYLEKFGILKAFNGINIILDEPSQKKANNTSKFEEVPMLPLELESDIIDKFKRINNITKEEIEKFIKDNLKKIGIKRYSYNQIQTYIKMYLSQFDSFEEEIKLYDSEKKKNIINECIEHFPKIIKYFIDSGFAKKIMDKNNVKDIFDLCLGAYDSDLSKEKFDTPFIYIDKESKTCQFEKLPDIAKEKDKAISNRDVDIVYLIDATGSMGHEIIAAKENVVQIFKKLTESNKGYNFRFGSVFYRDKIDEPEDENEFFQFTDNMNYLKEKIGTVKAEGGGDIPEDWVAGYEMALRDMKWRENGTKLIIHIADAGAHGIKFTKKDKKHDDQAELLPPKIKECVKRNINIIGFKIGKQPERSFNEISNIYNNFKKENIDYDNGQFIEIYEFFRDEENQKVVSDNFNKLVMKAAKNVINPSYKYLKRLKKILYLDNEVEEDKDDKKSLISILNLGNSNYVITEDNYKKMVLLVYRIKANVPVIIMGETGCGKTSLIKKLSQILNNGEELVKIINVHPGTTDEEITKKMEEMNEIAKSKKYNKKELWVFFDEINTCPSLALLTEIFVNRAFNGKKLEGNIRLIGACNPYRKRKEDIEICGLIREDDEDEEEDIKDKMADKLVYKVEQLPESLLYYVFSFGSISVEDEKKYIGSIIQKLFTPKEEKLHDLTTEAISKCHECLRKSFGDEPSIVSLREIARFTSCVEFFKEYFAIREKCDDNTNNTEKKVDDDINETNKLYKIKGIICSIYICYYTRLTNEDQRNNFQTELRTKLLNIVNWGEQNKGQKSNNSGDLLNQIIYQKFRKDLEGHLGGKCFENFSVLLNIEEEFLLEQVEPDKGIGKNQSLKENLFLIFLGVVTKIPLIIVGKPGTGKSLSAQLICNSMKGEYSKKEFFKNYPKIDQKYFQGSKNTSPEDVEKLFRQSEDLCNVYKARGDKSIPICMILFDELGLADQSKTNPLKVLHSKLEYEGKKEGTCFIGISNYSLDAAKVNRALNLSVPNLEDKPDQLKLTSESIVESIFDDVYDNTLIFNILSKAYFEYKRCLNFIKKLTALKQYINEKNLGGKSLSEEKNLKGKSFSEIKKDERFIKLLKKDRKIKTEFHGNRDFYSLIRGVAIELSQLSKESGENEIKPIINHFIERNFGGITYDIDIDFDLEFEDIKENMKILKEQILNEELEKIKKNEKGDDDDDDKKNKGKNDTTKNKIKVTSVFLFKKIYNQQCSEESKKYTKGETYPISKDDLVTYDLNKCINNNITDNNSRYLLLEIRSNLTPLITQIIQLQNSDRKGIDTLVGSPFSEDKNSRDYQAKKINEIQNCASQKYKLILLQNLDEILAYLYDLFNMNYKIIDDQKFVRICLENFSEQLTPVSESFKIIVLVDKKFVNKIDMAFLNRLEKMQINFQDLLDKGKEGNKALKELIETIDREIGLKEIIKSQKSRFNYDIKNLLINCNEQEIGGLVYYSYLKYANERSDNAKEIEDIKEIVYTKISNLLPQDIIVILPEGNPVKKRYEKKQYYNFIQYKKALDSNNKDLINCKVSIIYTFSDITGNIKDFNNDNIIMIDNISTEGNLKAQIDEIKNRNKDNNTPYPYILFKFEDYDSNKIQFTSDYIINYLKDEYHYIFIIYIHRYSKQRIYSIPNINEKINQLFIDNLEGPEIALNDLLTKEVKYIMYHTEVFNNLDKEFREALTNFIYDKLNPKLNQSSKKTDVSTYLDERYSINTNGQFIENLINYLMYNDIAFKNNIIEKAKDLITIDKDALKDCKTLINKIFTDCYMNKDKIDIVSILLDYIKENVFIYYLNFIFNVLEDNDFLTTLLELNNDKTCKLGKNEKNDKIIKDLENKFLNQIKVDNKKYEPKFVSNYRIPGFYNFYKKLSDDLSKDISDEFLNNEKSLVNMEVKGAFHKKEKELLEKALGKIKQDKLYDDLVNRINPDLMLKEYIIFYLEKYFGIYSKPLINLIILLLDYRFSGETNIIKNSEENSINRVIIKIIWIESYKDYIKDILTLFDFGKTIINDEEGEIFYNKIYNSIIDNSIKYKADKKRLEYTKEINECFYLVLVGLCLSVTTNNMDEMKISIESYCGLLKKIKKIIQKIDDNFGLKIDELFIMDELIKIIEYNPNVSKKIIKQIRDKLVENAKMIQKEESKEKLTENFRSLNDLLTKIKNVQTKEKYYATLKYIYKKEIEKVNDKIYCKVILEEIIKQKEILKISNDIIQYLLIKLGDISYFESIKTYLLDSKDNIITLIDEKLYSGNSSKDYYIALSEVMIYFFERISLLYLEGFSKIEAFIEEKEDKGHLYVFKECNKFLSDINKDEIDEELNKKNINITKIFCIGYIKTFCYMFIKMHNKKRFKPESVIEIINESDEINMVKLYIYKTIYNRNKKQMNIFLDDNIIKKYKLKNYKGFEEFIKSEDIEKLENLTFFDNKSNEIFKILEENSNNEFKDEISQEQISKPRNNFDDFYIAAYQLILPKLIDEDFEDDNSYTNFYENVCKPLYRIEDCDEQDNKLLSLLKIFFEKDTYLKFKEEYEIIPEDIEVLSYGYRYCLNEVKSKTNREGDYIYSYLYNKDNMDDFYKKFYPGNDNNKDEPYYELYNRMVKHFNENPDDGFYVCLCDKGYCHSVSGGFVGINEINMLCPKCNREIGAKEFYTVERDEENEQNIISIKVYKMVTSNRNYFRIFRDSEQINDLKSNKEHSRKFDDMNYMTVEEFKKKYIEPLYKNERGLNQIDINTFRKENKVVRNLSKISYRLLNYILYCNLFFAYLYTEEPKFNDYVPEGMTWISMINECFNKLKLSLKNKGIKDIQIFMNCIFKDLFAKLHNKNIINNFESLVEFEGELEELINKKCDEAKTEIEKYKEKEKKIFGEPNSAIALIKEIYGKTKYNSNEFRFYEYFYYTDYLNEVYIKKKIKEKDENDYPVITEYLKRTKKNDDEDEEEKDKYSLDNLIPFNKVLKLFNDTYSNKITRDDAEKQTINTSNIYRDDEKNAKLIDDFIELYNSFKLQDEERNILELNKEKNTIIDFLIIDDNKYGKSYKKMYKKFIKMQNSSLESLLNEKIRTGVFNSNSKNRISVQNIKDNEIFTPQKLNETFTNVIFNSSYRKYIDTKKHENYNEYEIRIDQIESEMTYSILNDKKLLNDDIMEFNFDNEVFTYEIGDLISSFVYNTKPINFDDKIVIYQFINDNDGNNNKYKEIIKDFITLIKHLNMTRKDKNNKINENTKICDIEIVKNKTNISEDFQKLFKGEEQNKKQNKKNEKDKISVNANFNVGKITNAFVYFLELIFKYVIKDIEKYQEKNKEEKSVYNFDDKNIKINKSDLAMGIRLFITLVLYRENENDKDKKIKSNKKNIFDYLILKNKDLWQPTLYNTESNKSQFESDLLKLKDLNIKIKEILYFYYYLKGENYEGFGADIKKHIEDSKKKKTKIKARRRRDENSDEDEEEEEEKEEVKPPKKNVGQKPGTKVNKNNKPPKTLKDDDDE